MIRSDRLEIAIHGSGIMLEENQGTTVGKLYADLLAASQGLKKRTKIDWAHEVFLLFDGDTPIVINSTRL